MIYTDELGRKCKATDAELQAYDEANGCERVPAKALDSLVALSGALLLIERNNELLEKFQFTPLREGRRGRLMCAPIYCEFQFTPLRKGRLNTQNRSSSCEVFQLTPLRKGRRLT